MVFQLPVDRAECCGAQVVVDRFGYTVCTSCGRSLAWCPDDVDSAVFGTEGDTRAWVAAQLRRLCESGTPSVYR